MIDAGVFDEDERVELLDGIVVAMSPQTERHAIVIERLSDPVFTGMPSGFVVRCQLPLAIGEDAEPEPDVAVLDRATARAKGRPPSTAKLVFEVSGESLRRDRHVKAELYAKAGVPEYVIVNLEGACLEVHRDPDPTAGRYRSMNTLFAADRFVSTAVPGFGFAVSDLLA